jgi:predicted O-methyltransferase YrrM
VTDAAARVRATIERVYSRPCLVAASDGSAHNVFPVAIPRGEGDALKRWVLRERPTRTIELGLGYGVSTLHICEALRAIGDPSARHVALDPNQHTAFSDCGLQLIAEADASDLVEHRPYRSHIDLPRLHERGDRFDFAFVDANHRFDGVFVDLVLLANVVTSGGIMFLDDYQLPSIRRAVSFFVTNRGWTLEETGEAGAEHHWAVLRTSTEPDTRPFDHFIEF